MDDAAAAIDAIESDYARHCRAAPEIAREYFAAEKVVGSLMERAGFGMTPRRIAVIAPIAVPVLPETGHSIRATRCPS